MDDLTPKQRNFAVAMVSSNSVSQAAESVGVTKRTGYNWLKLNPVQQAIRQVRQRKMFQISALVANSADVALNVLNEIMIDKKNNAQIRSQAAQFLLKMNSEMYEQDDLAARIEALENRERERDKYRYGGEIDGSP